MKPCIFILVFTFAGMTAHGKFESLNGEDPNASQANTSVSLEELGQRDQPGTSGQESTNNQDITSDSAGTLTGGPQAGIASGLTSGAQKASQSGQQAYAIGTVFSTQCGSQNYYACGAAALSFANGYKAFQQSKKLNRAASNLLTQSSPDLLNKVENDIEAANQSGNQALAALKKLESQGFVTSPDGSSVTGPDGQTISATDLQSASSLQAAGASASEALAFERQKNELQANGENSAGGGAAGGSGQGAEAAGRPAFNFSGFGGGRGLASTTEASEDAAKGAQPIASRASAGLRNRNRGNALSRPLGISRDDVFGIVTQKYRSNYRKNTFFTREF